MNIESLWATQRNLKREKDIPAMIAFLKEGGIFDVIELHECDDGEIQVNNGHHRIVSIYLSGRTYLNPEEYILIPGKCRPRLMKISELICHGQKC